MSDAKKILGEEEATNLQRMFDGGDGPVNLDEQDFSKSKAASYLGESEAKSLTSIMGGMERPTEDRQDESFFLFTDTEDKEAPREYVSFEEMKKDLKVGDMVEVDGYSTGTKDGWRAEVLKIGDEAVHVKEEGRGTVMGVGLDQISKWKGKLVNHEGIEESRRPLKEGAILGWLSDQFNKAVKDLKVPKDKIASIEDAVMMRLLDGGYAVPSEEAAEMISGLVAQFSGKEGAAPPKLEPELDRDEIARDVGIEPVIPPEELEPEAPIDTLEPAAAVEPLGAPPPEEPVIPDEAPIEEPPPEEPPLEGPSPVELSGEVPFEDEDIVDIVQKGIEKEAPAVEVPPKTERRLYEDEEVVVNGSDGSFYSGRVIDLGDTSVLVEDDSGNVQSVPISSVSSLRCGDAEIDAVLSGKRSIESLVEEFLESDEKDILNHVMDGK